MNDFDVLGFKENEVNMLTMKDVIKAYRRIAIKIHPDKAGSATTAEFQELLNSYRRVLEYRLEEQK